MQIQVLIMLSSFFIALSLLICHDMTYLTGYGCEFFTRTSVHQWTCQVYCRHGSSWEKKTNCTHTAEYRVCKCEECFIHLGAKLLAANRDYQDVEHSISILRVLFVQATNTDPQCGHMQSLNVSEQMPPVHPNLIVWRSVSYLVYYCKSDGRQSLSSHASSADSKWSILYFYNPRLLSHVLSRKYLYCYQSVESMIHSWFPKALHVKIKPQPHFVNRLSKVEAVIPEVLSCLRTSAGALWHLGVGSSGMWVSALISLYTSESLYQFPQRNLFT